MKFRKLSGILLAGVVAAGSMFTGSAASINAEANTQEATAEKEEWRSKYEDALIQPKKNPEEVWGDTYKVELRLSNGVHIYLPSFYDWFVDGQEPYPGGVYGYLINTGNALLEYINYDESTNTLHKGTSYFESISNDVHVGIHDGLIDMLLGISDKAPTDDEKHKYKVIGEKDGEVYFIDFTPPYWDEGMGWDSFPELQHAVGSLDYFNKYADMIADTAWVEKEDVVQSCDVTFNTNVTNNRFNFPPKLENEKIKLYKLSFDRYNSMIQELVGPAFYNDIGNATLQVISEAEKIDAWTAKEGKHIVNLTDGDYFLTVNDTLASSSFQRYFRIENNGKTITELEGGGYYNAGEIIYEEGKSEGIREINVETGDGLGLPYYLDPAIKTTDQSGNVIDCEIEVYKKEGATLIPNNMISKGDFFGDSNFKTVLEYPGTHIIRCKNAPYGYKKFDDVNVNIVASDITFDYGFPRISLDNSANALINPFAYYGLLHNTPAYITITMDEAEYGGLTLKNETGKTQTTTIECNYEDVTGVHGTSNQGDIVFDKGKATIDIDAGETIAINNIAEGTEYTVTANGCTVTGEKGTIKAGRNGEIVLKSIMPSGVSFSQKLLILDKGKTGSLTAKVTPDNAKDKSLTWSSSDPKVATVDTSGKVTAVNHGKAIITAKTANGKTATCEVRVNFADVASESLYYYKPVYWAAGNGITTGANGLFAPHNKCTREHAITFLWRMAGSPAPKSMTSKFKDITNQNSYSYKAIMWGTENGIITGANGVFAPNNTCTREQIVTMLWRLAGKPEPKNTASKFKDVQNKNSYSYKAILWAAEKGITTGANGSFAPGKVCTRAEIVTFIYRYKN